MSARPPRRSPKDRQRERGDPSCAAVSPEGYEELGRRVIREEFLLLMGDPEVSTATIRAWAEERPDVWLEVLAVLAAGALGFQPNLYREDSQNLPNPLSAEDGDPSSGGFEIDRVMGFAAWPWPT